MPSSSCLRSGFVAVVTKRLRIGLALDQPTSAEHFSGDDVAVVHLEHVPVLCDHLGEIGFLLGNPLFPLRPCVGFGWRVILDFCQDFLGFSDALFPDFHISTALPAPLADSLVSSEDVLAEKPVELALAFGWIPSLLFLHMSSGHSAPNSIEYSLGLIFFASVSVAQVSGRSGLTTQVGIRNNRVELCGCNPTAARLLNAPFRPLWRLMDDKETTNPEFFSLNGATDGSRESKK